MSAASFIAPLRRVIAAQHERGKVPVFVADAMFPDRPLSFEANGHHFVLASHRFWHGLGEGLTLVRDPKATGMKWMGIEILTLADLRRTELDGAMHFGLAHCAAYLEPEKLDAGPLFR